MSRRSEESPTVIIPYEGPLDQAEGKDIFVYLRPETNGVLAESSLIRVMQSRALYRQGICLVYLANVPGSYIVRHRIVEKRYRYKIPFARYPRRSFTQSMKAAFEHHFTVAFAKADVVGAFRALKRLGWNHDQLFHLRVPEPEMLMTDCQNIKHYEDMYIVNYDIPALLHKNSNSTNIAVMIFRSTLSSTEFRQMIDEVGLALRKEQILGETDAISRAFHYSKGPFDQLLDARGHLYNAQGQPLPLSCIEFGSFLLKRGVSVERVQRALDYPIMKFRRPDGELVEDCLFSYTADDSYEQAYQKLLTAVEQHIVGTHRN